MNKLAFIEYSANRYGIDFRMAETLVDMFASCLSELLQVSQSVEIEGIGKFEKLPLFPNGINHQNKIALARLVNKQMLYFKPDKYLIDNVLS